MPAAPADTQPRGAWWEVFGDPKLNDLEQQLTQANPDLQAAVARFEQARAVALQARSDMFPTIGAERFRDACAAVPRTRRWQRRPGRVTDSPPTIFFAGLNLAWEIDLFGRLRNAAAAAGAQAQASAADLAAVELALQAELASDYFSLRGDDTTIQLLEDTIKVYDHAFELTRNRYEEGISAATDVDQADTLRQNARSQLAAVRLQRAQLEHAIAVLLGQLPSGFALEPGALAGAPPAIERACLPGCCNVALMSRARNAPWPPPTHRSAWPAPPGFRCSPWQASRGYESILSSSWFNAPSRFWSIGPSATVPLLDAGARYAIEQTGACPVRRSGRGVSQDDPGGVPGGRGQSRRPASPRGRAQEPTRPLLHPRRAPPTMLTSDTMPASRTMSKSLLHTLRR